MGGCRSRRQGKHGHDRRTEDRAWQPAPRGVCAHVGTLRRLPATRRQGHDDTDCAEDQAPDAQATGHDVIAGIGRNSGCRKGWFRSEFEGHGAETFHTGSSWIQPPNIKHTVVGYSDDCELLEIVLPADFDTVTLTK